MSNHLLYVLGQLRHPRGKPLDGDPVRLCQTLARKGTAETRFEAVFGRSEANVPARQEPLQIVDACRLAWRSGQISDSETDLLRAAESPSPSGEGQLTGNHSKTLAITARNVKLIYSFSDIDHKFPPNCRSRGRTGIIP